MIVRRARPLLGTIVDIAAEGPADILAAAIDAAFAAIDEVQRLMSFHEATSDVSRINSTPAGVPSTIDPHTARVLLFARQLSDASNGAFDVTTAPVLVANGFLPQNDNAPPMGATYLDLEFLSDNSVFWRRKGWIDLGGIAKGYAVDCAVATLGARGVAAAIVNAGGDLRCFGRPQPILVRHPDQSGLLVRIGLLADAAVATSAGYFSRTEEGAVEPLVDPRGGRCVSWNGSVSVAAQSAMAADALTKVVALDPDAAPKILDRFGAQAIVIDRRGQRACGRPLLQPDLAR
jgi:FAD:protein FMN transferase